MRKIPTAIYPSPEKLEEMIRAREAEAAGLPPGEARQSILKDVSRLRMYADAKRLFAPSGSKSRG